MASAPTSRVGGYLSSYIPAERKGADARQGSALYLQPFFGSKVTDMIEFYKALGAKQWAGMHITVLALSSYAAVPETVPFRQKEKHLTFMIDKTIGGSYNEYKKVRWAK